MRVYEGCARSFLGQVDGADLIELNRVEPKGCDQNLWHFRAATVRERPRCVRTSIGRSLTVAARLRLMAQFHRPCPARGAPAPSKVPPPPPPVGSLRCHSSAAQDGGASGKPWQFCVRLPIGLIQPAQEQRRDAAATIFRMHPQDGRRASPGLPKRSYALLSMAGGAASGVGPLLPASGQGGE